MIILFGKQNKSKLKISEYANQLHVWQVIKEKSSLYWLVFDSMAYVVIVEHRNVAVKEEL